MHMEVEKQMSGRCLQWDPAWTLIPGHFPHHTEPTRSADVSADSSIPGTGPLRKLF